ncbi:hypothetical protein AB5J62_24765 [Amycolatopsis sp. cg5]
MDSTTTAESATTEATPIFEDVSAAVLGITTPDTDRPAAGKAPVSRG